MIQTAMGARRLSIMLAVLVLLANGCSSVRGKTEAELQTSDIIKQGGVFALSVSAPRTANATKAVEAVERRLSGKLLGSGIAKKLVKAGSSSHYSLSVELTNISVKWQGGKLVFGAFLGRQGITSKISVVHSRQKKIIRKATISGGAPADPANPEKALDSAAGALADEIIDFLLRS